MSDEVPSPPGASLPPFDPMVFVGESEGAPLIVQLDRVWGRDYRDPARGNAVMVELRLPRVDGHGLPVAEDWPKLTAIESALIHELAQDDQAWKYVVRLYGESVARFCFYAGRTAGAERAVRSVMSEFPTWSAAARVVIQSDRDWSAYARFFPDDAASARVAPSFRDESPYDLGSPTRPRPPREEQPWRGEDKQAHPEE